MSQLHSLGKAILAILLSFAVIRVAMHFSQDFRLTVYHVRDDVIMARLIPRAPKFWVHRCNDTRKMEEMMAKYNGVELDIIFYPTADGGFFDVSHDPQPTPRHRLDDFFALLASSPQTHCWLDFKNLNETTAQPALQELERLITTYPINKSRLIVESANFTSLGTFHRQGYYTSYYCPVDDERYLNTDTHKDEFTQIVSAAAHSGNVDAVSFDAAYYPLVKSAKLSIDMLSWHVGHYGWWDFSFDENLKPLTTDEQVKVILVSAHSRYNR